MSIKLEIQDNGHVYAKRPFISSRGVEMTDSDPEVYLVKPRFIHHKCKDDYIKSGVKSIVPMTANELESEEEQTEALLTDSNLIEEKFDGTRGVLQFFKTKKLRAEKLGLTEEEKLLCEQVLRGTGFAHGKFRVYEYYINEQPSVSDFAKYLSSQFGVGGGGQLNYNYLSDSKGMTIILGNLLTSSKEYKYTWSDVAQFTAWLINEGFYYPQEGYSRIFSRRESVKTGFFCENTDLMPHIRDINKPDMHGTVLDGEIFIPNKPFKEISSTLNCKWDEAVRRQTKLGQAVFHAFDILYYKGVKLEKMTLERRKEYLRLAIEEINDPHIVEVPYYLCGDHNTIPISMTIDRAKKILRSGIRDIYPTLSKELNKTPMSNILTKKETFYVSPRAYYEFIVSQGGEGVIIKPSTERYYHKRGKQYLKIKKFMTREVIVMGFNEPEKDYKGKYPTPEKWDYWETMSHDTIDLCGKTEKERQPFKKMYYPDECRPISKYEYFNWVGNVRYGVVITEAQIKKLPPKKKFNIESLTLEDGKVYKVIEVGECAGYNEEVRAEFTKNQEKMVGTVIEIKCNEIFRDTGRQRHPRYLRQRTDKSPTQCTWEDMIGEH